MSIPSDRIDSLVSVARDVFPECADFSQCQPWAGLRPATPTGLPIIGQHPNGPANLLFNTGHGALGFTLAFGSALRMARLVRTLGPGSAVSAVAATPASYTA